MAHTVQRSCLGVNPWYDLQGVLRLQAQGLNLAYLQQWAGALGIAALLHRAMEEAGLSDI